MSHSDKTGCTTVSYLEAVDCREPACVAALLQQAARQRAVGATAANERSSRSHMVFTLSVCGLRSADGQQLNGASPCTSLVCQTQIPAHATAHPVPDGSHVPVQITLLVSWSRERFGLMAKISVFAFRGAEPDRPGGQRAAEGVGRQRGAPQGDPGHQQEPVRPWWGLSSITTGHM